MPFKIEFSVDGGVTWTTGPVRVRWLDIQGIPDVVGLANQDGLYVQSNPYDDPALIAVQKLASLTDPD